MLNKVLLITLGGSGEKLARYLNQDLEQRLRAVDWQKGIPSAWHWLCVDIAHGTDVVTGDVPSSLGRAGTRMGLAHPAMLFRDYSYKITANPRGLGGLVGTLPDPSAEVPAPFKGAGQRPQVGHAVGLASLAQLKDEIRRQVDAMSGVEVADDLRDLSGALGGGEAQGAPGTSVIIASSLGGGSGAGLLQLVVELVLNHPATEDRRDDLTTVFFTPDIFSDLKEHERDGVHANALFTMASMTNGYESSGEVSDTLNQLLAGAGVNIDERRRAAVTNFFIGRSNGEITFDTQDAVIKSTAKALGRLIVDENVANGLEAHFQANRDGASVSAEYRITSANATSRAASSFGYASISLGEAQLAEYASERLARAQLETLLRRHQSLAAGGESDDAVAERIVKAELDWFLERAGLGTEKVLDEFYDRDSLRKEVQSQVKKVQDDLGDGGRKAEPSRWLKRIEDAFKSYQQKLDRERGASQAAKSGAWSAAVHRRLCHATAESIGRFGLPATDALLAAASAHLEDAASELDRERGEDLRVKSSRLIDQSQRLLNKLKARTVRGNNSVVDESSDARGKAVYLSEDAAYRELVADLLRGLPEGVLAPLRAALSGRASALAGAELKRDKALVASWSSYEVDPRLHPAPNQLLLEPVEEMPRLLDGLLEQATGKPVRNAEEQVVKELLTGEWGTESEGESVEGRRLIGVRRAWTPGGAPAEFEMDLTIPQLRDRAEQWVRFRPGAVSRRLRLSIAEWIGADPLERGEVFAGTLEQALRCAAPMIEINPAVHLRVHNTTPGTPKLHVSTLPVPDDDALRSRIAGALSLADLSKGEIAHLMNPASSARLVEISSFVSQPVDPVVIEGLYRPIESDWNSRTNSAMRLQFASYRRTRPLDLFVPMSRARQKLFVTGWVAADILGQLSDFSGDWDQSPIRVWSPEGWLQFPQHLLGGPVTEEEEVLAAVLESMPLAVASFASEQYEPLRAYMRVIDLGDLADLREAVATGASELDQDGAIGIPPDAAPRAGLTAGTPEARRQQALEKVDSLAYRSGSYLSTERLNRETVVSLTPAWEVGGLLEEALGELRKALIDLRLPSHDDDDDMQPAIQ